jgi:acyl carrier protein
MIPGAFVKLIAMPLSRNGKVDRSALPDPGTARPEMDAPFVPASSPVEVELASIWAATLEVEPVGIHDNFFDLGGQSLSAFRLISRVVQSFGLDLPLKTLFQAPTVAAMAKVIQAIGATDAPKPGLERASGEIKAASGEAEEKTLTGRG